nr:hypothetical protein [Sinorhizobium medicae]
MADDTEGLQPIITAEELGPVLIVRLDVVDVSLALAGDEETAPLAGVLIPDEDALSGSLPPCGLEPLT